MSKFIYIHSCCFRQTCACLKINSVNMKRAISYTKYSRFKEFLKCSNTRNVVLGRTLSTATNAEHETASHEDDGTHGDDGTEEFAPSGEKYPGHRPTTVLQKVLLTAGSAAMSLYNPSRGDMVAAFADVTAFPALKHIKEKMEDDPVGQQILAEQPVISTETVSIDYLGALPENTFGKEYWRFLSKHGFSPDERPPVHYVDDHDLMYVMLRYRQCHDLFHTVLGMKPHMLGEVAVKWVEAIQTGLPMCALAAVFGPLRLGPVHRQKYTSTYLPWAIRNGRNAKMLMCVYFEKHWERDLQELRDELNIEPPPEIPYPS